MVSPEYKEELCKELAAKLTKEQWEAREALDKQFEAYDEIKNEADDIREAHDFFDEKNMTDEEIIEAQIDLIETARNETAEKISEVEEEMRDDWSDAHGAGADTRDARETLDSLEKYTDQLDEVQERLENAVRYFREKTDDYDKASKESDKALENWSEHCEDEPPEEEEEEEDEPGGGERPKEQGGREQEEKEQDEDEQGGFGGEDPDP